MPTVSIVVPAYNVAAFLQGTIDSVLNQTDLDWEAIIVDDGSSDATGEVAGALARAHPDRVFVIRQPNAGQGAARNRGARHARGELLGFLDADDLWEPDKLARQRAYLAEHPDVAVVCGDVISIDESGGLGFAMMRFKRPRSGWVLGDLLQENFVSIPTTLIRKSAFDEVGGFCEDRDIGVEDYHLWLRMARRHPFGFLNRVLAKYRIRAGSFSSQHVDMWKKTIAVLDRVAREDPSIAREFGAELRRGQARNLFEMGYHLSRSGDVAGAKRSLWAALRLVPGHRAAWKEWLTLTLVPGSLLRYRNSRG